MNITLITTINAIQFQTLHNNVIEYGFEIYNNISRLIYKSSSPFPKDDLKLLEKLNEISKGDNDDTFGDLYDVYDILTTSIENQEDILINGTIYPWEDVQNILNNESVNPYVNSPDDWDGGFAINH